jgi:hypothetical protein
LEIFLGRATASLIRPAKSEVKWHILPRKSPVLSPKPQVYGAKSSAGGKVSFQIQIADAKQGNSRNSQAACLPPQSV